MLSAKVKNKLRIYRPYLLASACLSTSNFFAIALEACDIPYALIISSARHSSIAFFELNDFW